MDYGGDCSIVRMSETAWWRYWSVVTVGKGMCSGKKSIVSAFALPLVEVMKHS